MRAWRAVISVVLVAASPLPAFGDNLMCPNADYLFPGQVLEDTLSTNPAPEEFIWFKTNVVARRSYGLYVWAPDRDAGEGGNNLIVSVFEDDCSSTAFNVNVLENEPLPDTPASNNVHYSIEPTTSGTIRLGVLNMPAAMISVNVLLLETTLFSPWWFIGGDYSAFIVVHNTTSQATTAGIWLLDSTGTLCGSDGVMLAPNGNGFINVRNYAPCLAAGFGSAIITHDSSPGGIVANTTVISASRGVSFDEPFIPRMVWGPFMRK
jgi:hypothetical protein